MFCCYEIIVIVIEYKISKKYEIYSIFREKQTLSRTVNGKQ